METDELLVEIAVKDNTNLPKAAEDIDVLEIWTGKVKAEEEIYFFSSVFFHIFRN